MVKAVLIGKHRYSLASSDQSFGEQDFLTRSDAKREMNRALKERGISVVEVYDDKHDKTYCCSDGTKFFINRI